MKAAALKGSYSMTIVHLPDGGPPPGEVRPRVAFRHIFVSPDA